MPAGSPLPKPSNLARWMNDANAANSAMLVEPPEGKKDVGWQVAEKPPAQFMNWWSRQVYKWVEWLNDLAHQAVVWTNVHTFQKGVVVTNSSTAVGLHATGGAARSGVEAHAGTGDADGLKAYGSGSGNGAFIQGGSDSGPGLYVSAGGSGGTGAVIYATGAAYGAYIQSPSGTAVHAQTGGAEPALVAVSTLVGGTGGAVKGTSNGNNSTANFEQLGEGYALFVKKTTAGGVATVYVENNNSTACISLNQTFGFTRPALLITNGCIVLSGTQPAKNADPGQDNALHATNIAKAWGSVTVIGLGSGNATLVLEGGYNVASLTLDGSTGVWVHFARDMSAASYAAPLERNALGCFPYVLSRMVDKFLVRFEESGLNANITTGGETRTFGFVVHGRQ